MKASATRKEIYVSARCSSISPISTFTTVRNGLALGSLATALAFGFHTRSVLAEAIDLPFSQNALVDYAKILPSQRREPTNTDLLNFEEETGWRIRVLSAFQGESMFTEDDIRKAWKPDAKTVIIAFDPSSPNIVAFRYIGDDVQAKLRRPFWIELQSRFGNIFFIRKEGEAAAVDGVVESVKTCLERPKGCRVVPGLSMDQFLATFVVSIAGGTVLGFSSKIEAGSAAERLGWIIAFSPLWLILFINLGIGPIVSRTEDRLPLIANCGIFALMVLIFQWIEFPPKWMKADINEP